MPHLPLTVFILLALVSSASAVDRAGPTAAVQPELSEQITPESPVDRQPDDMSWWSVDGGGGESSGGSYTLFAAAGQADAGSSYSCSKVLDGGLWSGAVDLQAVFCDSFESSDTSMWDNTAGGTAEGTKPSPTGGE